MENAGEQDLRQTNGEMSALDQSTPLAAAQGSGGYRLFDRQRTIYQIIGGGKGN